MSIDQAAFNEFISKRAIELKGQITFEKSQLDAHSVKRGLRNKDGTGVMAGITRIGSTQGDYMRDGDKTAMEGRLYYRGINVSDIVSGFLSEERPGYEETAYLLIFGKLPSKSEL